LAQVMRSQDVLVVIGV